ncbi:hypothetical protein [Streptosporangium sp. NPDC004631]
MAESERVKDVLSLGIAIGIVTWGAVGAWTALTVENYPWNQWVPFAYGASKGVVLGMLAAVGATIVLNGRHRNGWRWAVFVSALIGGSFMDTLRDLAGPPARALYFEPRIPDERWYWTTMLSHWTGKVILPAIVCAIALALLVARPYRKQQSILIGAALTLGSIALLLLPVICSVLAPEIQGSGGHTDWSFSAFARCWGLGIPLLIIGMLRTILLSRSTSSSVNG